MDHNVMSIWVRQKRVLESMDYEGAWEIMHHNGSIHRPSNEVMEISMHKARVELTFIEPKFRLQSVEWLRARGLSRQGGVPLPPKGVLPV